jgi:branched-chain amino acid transport system substrate-binding protein
MKQGFRCTRKVEVLVLVALVIMLGFILQANAAEKLKIGVIIPLTGPVAEGGTRMLKAFELARDEINAKGGVLGKEIELVVWDDGDKVERGITGAKKLIDVDDVWCLAGVYRSGIALPVSDIAANSKKIFMVTDAASPDITGKVLKDYNTYKYIFRAAASTDHFALIVTPFLTDIVKAKSYYYMSENTKWTQDLGKTLRKFADEKGIKFLGESLSDPGATEFMSEITKIKELKPDAVVCTLAGAGGIPFAKQYYDMKAGSPIVNAPGVMTFKSVIDEMKEKSDYASVSAFCWDVAITDKTIPFYKKFTEKYDRPGGYEDVRSYDGLYVITEGIKKAGTFDTDKVISALEKIEYTGVAGRYVFDKSHQAQFGKGYLTGVIIEWKNQKSNILYPPNVATSKYIPAPWSIMK